MGGIHYISTTSSFIGYYADIDVLLEVNNHEYHRKNEDDPKIVKAISSLKKVGNESMENLINRIRSEYNDEIEYSLNEMWRRYLKSRRELLNYKASSGLLWSVFGVCVYNYYKTANCLNFGFDTSNLNICHETGLVSSTACFPPNCREIIVDFLANIKFLLHKDSIAKEKVEEMKIQFRESVSSQINFGVKSKIDYDD